MYLGLALFIIGAIGFIFNRNNLILMIIAIEIMLLGVSLIALLVAWGTDDIQGQVFSLFIISVAGAESAIGLAIIIAYYKLRKL